MVKISHHLTLSIQVPKVVYAGDFLTRTDDTMHNLHPHPINLKREVIEKVDPSGYSAPSILPQTGSVFDNLRLHILGVPEKSRVETQIKMFVMISKPLSLHK